ncbi:Kinesin-like protein kip2 [Sorochytrium milnesiophthora]
MASAAAAAAAAGRAENVQVTVRVRPLTVAEERARQEVVWEVAADTHEVKLSKDYAAATKRPPADYNYGVIPLAVEDVFSYIRESSGKREFLLRVSYMEIYNESVRDLLSPDTVDLRIHEDKKRGVYVSPLKEEIVTSPKQVMRVIQRGEANRHISTTDYNEHSSRSHTIFQMIIESREMVGGPALPSSSSRHSQELNQSSDGAENGRLSKAGSASSLGLNGGASLGSAAALYQAATRAAAGISGKGQTVRVSLLNLIDLAGSEKAASNVDRRKEGAYINKSLLTLGSVIAKLTEERSSHIPYRDSKLTRILQSSLSGQARVSVICTISPAALNVEESTNTLKFAARVKKVVTRAKENEIMDDKALLQKYRLEIVELRDKLMQTNEAYERERQQELMTMQTEREKYEEELHEQQLLRTALKERIDHLTRLILTSGSLTSKTLNVDATSKPPSRRVSQEFGSDKRFDVLNQELVQKEVLVQKATRTIETKERYIAQLEEIVRLAASGDASGAAAAFQELERARDDVASFSGLALGEDSLLSRDNVLQSMSSLSERGGNEELVKLKQSNRELEIVVVEQEEKIQQLEDQLNQMALEHEQTSNIPTDAAERIDDLDRELAAHRDMLEELTHENHSLKHTIAELKDQLRQRDMQSFEKLEAQTAAVPSAHDAERTQELEFMYENERRLRVEEQQRNRDRIGALESELAVIKAELSVAQLVSNMDTGEKT